LQALYQVMVGGNPADEVDIFTRDLSGFHKADAVHFDALLHGCAAQAEALDALILPVLDRKLSELSPIEHGVLWIGAYELQHCVDIPWRVVLNECIDLAKEFGGTDGHKYVNAVLNQLAQQLRLTEVQSERSKPAASVAATDDSTTAD
jgi:N utilization substance protein B